MRTTLTYQPNLLLLQRYLRHLGVAVSRTEISRLLLDGEQSGLTFSDITRLLGHFGVKASSFRVPLEYLDRVPLPALALLDNGGRKYYAVLEAYREPLLDTYLPSRGTATEPLSALAGQWTGYVLCLEAVNDEFQSEEVVSEAQCAQQYRENGLRVIDGFLSAEACGQVIAHAESGALFRRSFVENNHGESGASRIRTSYSAVFRDRDTPVLQDLYHKADTLLRAPGLRLENIQCVRYQPGQEFRPHWDNIADNDRIRTGLIYLNDDFEGGETYFPLLDLKVRPVRGRMLVFDNWDEGQGILEHSLHAGLPVLSGVKYACNAWVRHPKS